jgi:uncharacterized membrane protein
MENSSSSSWKLASWTHRGMLVCCVLSFTFLLVGHFGKLLKADPRVSTYEAWESWGVLFGSIAVLLFLISVATHLRILAKKQME